MERVDGWLEQVDGRIEQVEGRMERIEGHIQRKAGRLGHIEGNQYEEKVLQQTIPRSAALGLLGPRVAYSKKGLAAQQFHEAMSAAVGTHLIYNSKYVDLTGADLIIRGTNQIHAVFEISIGPDGDDITRALRQAEILARATGETVIPAVIAPSPPQGLIKEASALEVQVLDFPE